MSKPLSKVTTRIALGALSGFLTAEIGVGLTTVFSHRGLAHKGVEFGSAANKTMRGLTWGFVGLRPRQWAGIHRIHHAKSDRPGDPHSPFREGLAKVVFNSMGLYTRFGIEHAADVDRVTRDIPNGPELFKTGWGVAIPITIVGVLTRDPVFVAAGIAAHAVTYLGLQGVVNGLAHWGDISTGDPTKNLGPIVGVFSWGETYHRNHHTWPTSPRLGFRRGEPDPGWFAIRMLEKMGQARITRVGQSAMDRQLTTPSV